MDVRTYSCQKQLTLSYRPTASEEADHHDGNPHSNQNVAANVQLPEQFRVLDVARELRVEADPEAASEDRAAQQLKTTYRDTSMLALSTGHSINIPHCNAIRWKQGLNS